jgi:predicted dienelactone hydrolase
VLTWLDDFSEDIKRVDVPTLILHGTADRILPIDGLGRRLHAALPDARYVEIDGGPHVGCVTHAKEINAPAAGVPARDGARGQRRLRRASPSPAAGAPRSGRPVQRGARKASSSAAVPSGSSSARKCEASIAVPRTSGAHGRQTASTSP